MDFSSTLLNGAAFYKQPKNFKILPACSLCPCPSPLAEALGSWRWPSLHQLFSHLPVPQEPHCYPVTASQGQVTPLAHRNSFEELALA